MRSLSVACGKRSRTIVKTSVVSPSLDCSSCESVGITDGGLGSDGGGAADIPYYITYSGAVFSSAIVFKFLSPPISLRDLYLFGFCTCLTLLLLDIIPKFFQLVYNSEKQSDSQE